MNYINNKIMTEKPENAKDKYTKILQEFRIHKTESNLQNIYNDLTENKNNLLDNDIIPFQYSNDLIWLLFNNIIDLKIQSDIFKLYIDSFFTFKVKSDNLQKLSLLDQIFKYDSFLYKTSADTEDFNCFIKKYFDKYYPKKKKIKYEPGLIVDVFISEKDLLSDLLYGWVQLPIKRIENNYVIFNDYDDENKELKFLMDSYEIQEKNTFVTTEEMNWRDGLKRGDKLDFLNNKRYWVEADMINVLNNNAVISVLGGAQGDNIIRHIYSPLIKPLSTFSFKYEESEKLYFPFIEYNYNYSKFNYCLPVPKVIEGEETNFLLPNNYLTYHSLLFYDIFNYYINKLISGKVFENLPDDILTIEYIYKIVDILNKGFEILNQRFFGNYFKDIMFPRIKKILLNISTDKKKNLSKIMISKILEISLKFLNLTCYNFQIQKIFLEFVIKFGLNCFKESENLEKRLIGLNSILLGLKTMHIFSQHNIYTEYNLLIYNNFLCDDENDLLGLLFNKSNIHEQLILKGTEIIYVLYNQNLLDKKDINKLYNFAISSQEGTEIYTQLYKVLTNMSHNMSLSQSQILINKIITFPLEQIRQEDVDLIFSIIQSIRTEYDYKKTINDALDFVYKFIISDTVKGKNFINNFTRAITCLQNDDDIFFCSYYIEKIINELLNKKTWREMEFFYDFLSYFILAFKAQNKDIMKSKFVLYLNRDNNSKKLLDNLLENIEDNTEEISEKKKIEHITAIIDSIKSIIFFAEYKYFFTTDSIMKLCDIFLFCKKKQHKQGDFLRSLLFLKRNNFMNVKEFAKKFFTKLDVFVSEINKDNYHNYYDIIDYDYAETVLIFYQTINHITESSEDDSDYINDNCYIKNNPLDFEYFEIVWKMFTKIDQNFLMKKFLNIFSLRLFNPKERHEIWIDIIKKIFDEEENFIDSNIALNMIIDIIEFSEVFGTAGTISHSLEKVKKFPLKLSIKSKINTIPEIELNENIYTTSTLYDVKKEIQKKVGIDPILIDFCKFNNFDMSSDSNGKNLSSIFFLQNNSTSTLTTLTKEQQEKKYNLTMKKSQEFYSMKKLQLSDDNKDDSFNEKTMSIFHKLFNEATNYSDKMDKKTLYDFYIKASAISDKHSDSAIYEIFSKYDKDKKGFWTFDNFIELFLDSYKENKVSSIFMNLNNLGYRNDLELIATPFDSICPLYYEENNVCEYMPRYFIGNNIEYMNKLFNFSLSNDKSVHELAQKIIKELCTMTQMKNLLFDKKSENKKIIDDLLEKDNLEMRTYAFDIILSELEKNNETSNKDIQLAIISFIENNLEKIINNFDDYITNLKDKTSNDNNFNNKENTQFIQFLNYYHVNIQIIFFSLKRLIDDYVLFELLNKFDDEMENKESIILNTISNLKLTESNLKILNNINLEKIFNIIITYLLFIKDQIKTVLYDLKISYKILIIIFILLDQNLENNSKFKENIYNKYILDIVNLCKSSLIKSKKLFQYTNEFILFLKKNDKNFTNKIKEEMSKEIIKSDILNKALLSKNYIFIVFKNIIEVLIRKDVISSDDNSVFNLFKSIINIISNEKSLLRELLITDYLEVLSLLINKLKETNNKSFYEYDFNDLLTLLINNYLINTKKNNNYSKYNDRDYISTLFELINNIISINPNKYVFTFFENEEIKNIKIKHLSNLPDDKLNYDPKIESKNLLNYLGLKNLSSLCYMNSVIQQLYMIPIFKKSILNLKMSNNRFKIHENEDIDDLLFQLIKMFYYLTYSDKSYYNPKQFVYSFKDYEGNPTNPNVQCDAQEFLTRFIEKIEDKIRNTSERFLCHNILGGTTLQQIICTNTDCNNISKRIESIVYLSLDIKGNHTLYQCLDKYIGEEKIEDYHCEKCDKKITHIKKVLIDKLPNILILHLQRIAFNYETFLMEKINDEVYFEREINIKKYTVDKNNKDIDTEKYEYELVGIIIHNGTAQYGHYYSVIFSQDRKYENKWYKFNDTTVGETSYDAIQRDISVYSGNREYIPSPYMLLYKKKIKNPVIVNIREINENQNILNLLKDETNINITDNGVNYEIYNDEKEAIEKNKDNGNNDKEIILKDKKLIGHLISYDESINYINKINENNKEENILFKPIILEENIKFCNDKKIYSSSFIYFIYNITREIKYEIIKENSIAEKYIPIIKLINDYLLNILSISWFKDDLKMITDNLITILKSMPSMISYLIKDIIEPKKELLLLNYLLSKDAKLGEAFSNYFANILIISIENNIENETSLQIIKYYLDKIPVEISKKWTEMEFFNNFILILIEQSDIIKKKFLEEEIISKLIDFIMVKESPLYKGDQRNENKNIKGKLGPLVRSIAFLYQYYMDNKGKDETLKLSENDDKMINHIPFYEKIILDEYDEKGSSILIKLKIDSSIKINEPNNKDNLDLIIKLKIPSSKSIDSIISSLNLIDMIWESFKEEKNKNELLNKIFGVPSIVVDSGEAKICYLSGAYYNYYSILNNIAIKKEINEDMIPLLLNIFKLLNKYEDVYEYICKLPAPNSYTYKYNEYLIKLYLDTLDKIKKNDNINDNKLYDDLILVMDEFCKKYNINLDSIKNDITICINNYMLIYQIKFENIEKSDNVSNEIKKKISTYDDKIKAFHFKFYYKLTQDSNKTLFNFFTEKVDINYHSCKETKSDKKNNDLENYCIEGIFILGLKDCNLSFSIEPFIYSNMEIIIKKFEKYFIFIKEYNLLIKEDDYDKDLLTYDFDIDKLVIGDIQKDNNKISDYSETQKIQMNEDAIFINCPLCGTPNVIDEHNQTFQCIFCSASLL